MQRALFTTAAAALLAALPLHAEDAADVQKLESLGAKVTQTAGAITEIAFTDCSKLGDAEYRALGQLTGLKRLTLFGGKHTLTDETVGHLLGLQQLESFSSEGAWLSDAGLARLAALKSLRSAAFFHLSVRKEGFNGLGFAAWKALPKLTKLTVAGILMGDDAFAEIAKLPLTTLKIGQRLPRGAGVPPSFSDASLPTLARIKTLETLRLTEARLSLAALRALKDLPKLKQLLISECELSESDLAALRSELPAVKIDFQPQTDEQRKKLEMYLR